MALTDSQVFFGGNDLSAIVGASLIDHDFNRLPSREIRTYKLARANKSVTTSAEYASKEVTVGFHLRGCDRGEAEAVLNDLKSYLRPVSKPLIVSQGGLDVIYNGSTLNEVNMSWFSNKIILSLVFNVADPIGYEDATSTLLSETVTNSTASISVDVDGSFDIEPRIILDYAGITGGSAQQISVKNEETGQGITLTGDFTTGDTIEIDSAEQTVIMNGANLDFSGNFPVWPPNNGAFGYVDTFTTRTVDIIVTYEKRIL